MEFGSLDGGLYTQFFKALYKWRARSIFDERTATLHSRVLHSTGLGAETREGREYDHH
jgi:hypothetical protein